MSSALGHAPPRPGALLRLALPMAASAGLGFFMHYANRTVLAWHSPESLAASLPAGMTAWTFQSFFIVTCGYLGTFAAQHHAAGEDEEAGRMVWPMAMIAAGAAVVCTLLILLRHPIAAAYGTAPGVAADLAELLAWYLGETALNSLVAGIGGFAGGIGRTGLVMLISAVGCALSIALNLWWVRGGLGVPALGVTGAGLATVVTAGVVAAIWVGWLLHGERARRFQVWRGRRMGLERGRVLRFLRYASPRGASEVLEMLAFVAFTAVITRMSTEQLAAANLAMSTWIALLVPAMGFAQGIGIAVGQAVGAGHPEHARRAVALGWRMLMPYLILTGGLLAAAPQVMLAPGRAPGMDDAAWAAFLAMAQPVALCIGLSVPADGLHHLYRFALGGAGDTRWPFVVLVAVSILGLAVPAWILAATITDPGVRLWAVYLLMAAILWLMAGIMWWRWRFGPWPTMSVRS